MRNFCLLFRASQAKGIILKTEEVPQVSGEDSTESPALQICLDSLVPAKVRIAVLFVGNALWVELRTPPADFDLIETVCLSQNRMEMSGQEQPSS